jgi:hypothetical protein
MSEVVGRVIHMTPADLLDFEARWPRHSGYKETAIIDELGIAPARYYQLLGRAIDTREALEQRPMLVHRLRRIRDRRSAEHARRTGAA